MAMFVKELKRCLREIDDSKKVGIDGLTLRQIGDPQVYAEVGGMPEEPPLECSTHGIPIFTREQKLNALLYCVQDESWEDVAGHLCDLLELARTKILPMNRAPFRDLREMVDKFGKHPTPIKEG